jgi:HEAT repeat protein
VKRKADTFLLESLRQSHSDRGLLGPGIYLRPTDYGIRWLLLNVPKNDAPMELRRQGMRLLSSHATKRHAHEAREVFLAALGDKDAEVRRNAMQGLGNLGAKESELALYRRLANDPDVVIRRRVFGMVAGTPASWATPLVIEGLRSSDQEIRRSCVWGIRIRKDKSLVPDLIGMLKREPHGVRGNFTHDLLAA